MSPNGMTSEYENDPRVTYRDRQFFFEVDGVPHVVRHTAFSWSLLRGVDPDFTVVDCGTANPDDLIRDVLGAPQGAKR